MVIRRLAGGRYPWMFQKGPGVKTFVNLAQRLKALNNQVIRWHTLQSAYLLDS